jgi:transposase
MSRPYPSGESHPLGFEGSLNAALSCAYVEKAALNRPAKDIALVTDKRSVQRIAAAGEKLEKAGISAARLPVYSCVFEPRRANALETQSPRQKTQERDF